MRALMLFMNLPHFVFNKTVNVGKTVAGKYAEKFAVVGDHFFKVSRSIFASGGAVLKDELSPAAPLHKGADMVKPCHYLLHKSSLSSVGNSSFPRSMASSSIS